MAAQEPKLYHFADLKKIAGLVSKVEPIVPPDCKSGELVNTLSHPWCNKPVDET